MTRDGSLKAPETGLSTTERRNRTDRSHYRHSAGKLAGCVSAEVLNATFLRAGVLLCLPECLDLTLRAWNRRFCSRAVDRDVTVNKNMHEQNCRLNEIQTFVRHLSQAATSNQHYLQPAAES